MRILVLNYEFPPLGGGAGRFAADLSRQLARLGHRVRVQTSSYRGLPKIESTDGVEVYRHWSPRRYPHTCSVGEMGVFLLANFFPALNHTFTWRPDLLHVHFAVPTGVLGYLIHRISDIPYVLSAHLGDVPGGVPAQTEHLFKWLKPFTHPIWEAAAAVTVPSEYIGDLAHKAYRVPVAVISNGIELQSQPSGSLTPHQPVRLIFAGRFSPQKNLLFLLEVLNQVKDLPWHLDLVGDGPLMSAMRAQARHLGLRDRLHFHGWLGLDAVAEIMSRGDILVLPSLWEGLPLVGVEALAAGLAIVGSDIGGIAPLVRQEVNGFLCPVNDTAAFAGALQRLLVHQDLLARMKAESRRLAAAFDISKSAAQFEALFQAVVKKK
jgi:glycosyltransferase involved in cell wall biosynthesis